MTILKFLWRRLTHTKALEKSSGELENAFFETVNRVLYITGHSRDDDDIAYIIYSGSVRLLIFLMMCGECWYALTETQSLEDLAASVNICVIQFITIGRFVKVLTHAELFRKLSTSMESPYFDISTEGRRNLVEYWAKKNENYLKLVLFLGNCTLAAWFSYPIVDELEYNVFISIRLPFDYRTPVSYTFTYIAVMITFAYVSHFVMVNDLLMQAHLIHQVCQFAVLSDCFENILQDCELEFPGISRDQLVTNDKFRERYKKRLGDLIMQHRFLLDNTMELRRILSGPMLGQLAASGTLICFIGYQAITTLSDNLTKFLMSMLYLSYNLFGFYIICRWCEEITVQSLKVGEAAYCSNWEGGLSQVTGVKSCLMLVITRASKPLILTAGGMYNLSLMSYTSLVKASYSALTVLLRSRQT